jgi:hypothetical protein
MISPYWGVGFFEFFQQMFFRLFTGPFQAPVSDEIQVGVLFARPFLADLSALSSF